MTSFETARRRGRGVLRSVAALTVCAISAVLLPAAHASPLFPLPSGQDVTTGGASNPRTVQTAANNPAAPVTSDLGAFWFGLGGAGVGYEVGDLNNLVDQADDLKSDLEQENLTQADAEALELQAEAFLKQINERAFVKVFANAQPPLLPMGGSMAFLGGAFTLGATAISGARLAFLGNDINAVNTGTSTACNTNDCELETNFSGYGKAAAGGVVSLGYSGGVHHRADGSLFVGGRLSYYTIELSKGLIAFDEQGSGTDGDVQDDVEDEFDRNRLRSTDLGLDLGVLWAAHNFRAGATLRNVNEPQFDYPAIGVSCAAKPANSPERANCEAALAFSVSDPTRVQLRESYVMTRQLQFETAVFTADRTLSLGITYDADAARDAVGDEYQWLGVTGSFTPGGWGWLVPGLRVGYRQNQAGSELDMATLGLSLFRIVNLDFAASTDSVENDGDEVPRSAMASLSFELFF
jgi:hypothetical protein